MNVKRFAVGLIMTALSVAVIFFVVNRLPYPGVKAAFRVN